GRRMVLAAALPPDQAARPSHRVPRPLGPHGVPRPAVPVTPGAGRTRCAHQRTAGLARMTNSGYHIVMKQVRIAELKAKLSEYLRAVRRGETIAVLDRETPIAQIMPVRASSALRVRKPAPGSPPPNRVPLPKPAKLPVDIVQLLLEERQGQR